MCINLLDDYNQSYLCLASLPYCFELSDLLLRPIGGSLLPYTLQSHWLWEELSTVTYNVWFISVSCGISGTFIKITLHQTALNEHVEGVTLPVCQMRCNRQLRSSADKVRHFGKMSALTPLLSLWSRFFQKWEKWGRKIPLSPHPAIHQPTSQNWFHHKKKCHPLQVRSGWNCSCVV